MGWWRLVILMTLCVPATGCRVYPDQLPLPGWSQIHQFGSNPGNLAMFRYTPRKLPGRKAPLVIALHGCFGSALQFSAAGFNELADKHGFFVVYPEQRPTNNSDLCFNHFQPGNPLAGDREIASVMQMVAYMLAHFRIAREQVYVAGFSSGGQFANILAAKHPRTFAAAAIVGAGGYRCEPGHRGIRHFFHCDEGTRQSPAAGKPPRRWPRISIWHGKLDLNVTYDELLLAVSQWKAVHRIHRPPKVTMSMPGNVLYEAYKGRSGETALETYTLNKMAHTVPIRADCGKPGEYFSLEQICFARQAVRFFGIR